MQALHNECATLTGLSGLRYCRCVHVCRGQTLVVVHPHSPPFAPLFERLSVSRADARSHKHARALLLAQDVLRHSAPPVEAKTRQGGQEEAGQTALVFLLCLRCFAGVPCGARAVARRVLVWQLVDGAWAPLRLCTTSDLQRGLVVSAWEIVEELVGRCLASVGLCDNPFRADLPALLDSCRTPTAAAAAAGALVNFLWEVWSFTSGEGGGRDHSVPGVPSTSEAYARALFGDIAALCRAHFVSLEQLQHQQQDQKQQQQQQQQEDRAEKVTLR